MKGISMESNRLFIGRKILDQKDPELVKSWVQDEEKICTTYIFRIALVSAVIAWLFFMLDHRRSNFNLEFSLWHRGGMSLLSLITSAAIYFRWGRRLAFPFALYKGIFAISILYISGFQNILMFRDPEVPRFYGAGLLIMAAWGADVGPKSTTVFSLVHALLLSATGFAFHGFTLWPGFVGDISIEIIAVCIAFSLASRYSLKVESKIKNWEYQNTLRHFSKHVSAQLTKLVLPHQISEIQSGKHLEQTMPTKGGDHCVMSFDIIGSSKVEHPYFGVTVEQFQSRCWKILNRKYDPQTRLGEAYRIKEMGDGFLSSIGFPLNFPEGLTELETAHEIALLCIEAFDETMKGLNYYKPIYCAVGLAWGHIEGYFPVEYPVTFDLRGRGIVLATRYQELRKALPNITGDSHVIIASRAFYLGLSESSRNLYDLLEFPDTFTMRDDEKARCAYILRVPSSQFAQSPQLAKSS